MFGIGAGEFILILVVGLIVFGPSKLPEVGRSLGKALREFRRAQAALSNALAETEAEIKSEPSTSRSNASAKSEPSVEQKNEPPLEKRTTVDDVTNMINAKPIAVPSATAKLDLSKTEAAKET